MIRDAFAKFMISKQQGLQMIYPYFRKILAIVVLVLTIGFGLGSFVIFPISPVLKGSVSDRVAEFPDWQTLPLTQPVKGDDLIYPDWFAGEWRVESTLVELEAPLAPEIRTPGFEKNRSYLNQPVYFTVRFGQQRQKPSEKLGISSFWANSWAALLPGVAGSKAIVADRAFNGLSIAQAYLGTEAVRSVQVDPLDPNRQITTLADGVTLLSVVTERSMETPDPRFFHFLTTELTQQFFQGRGQTYLNVVETTTDYRYDEATAKITADQMTAIYLSPQDPNYFQALNHPVALYRYGLNLERSPEA